MKTIIIKMLLENLNNYIGLWLGFEKGRVRQFFKTHSLRFFDPEAEPQNYLEWLLVIIHSLSPPKPRSSSVTVWSTPHSRYRSDSEPSSLFATSVALLLVKRSFSVRFHYTTVGVFNYAFEFVGVIFSEFALKMAFN